MPVLDELDSLVAAGQPLAADQLRALAASHDLVRLGMLGDQARRRRHGDATTFVRVARVSLDQAESAPLPAAAGEVWLDGVPASAEEAVDRARALVARAGRVPVTAYSLADLERLAGPADLCPLIERLQAAGVAGVAEAPLDALGDPVRAVSAVVKAGSTIARLTVHRLESLDAALDLLRSARALQKATGAIHAFAPLPRRIDPTAPSTGYTDVKLVAIARLALTAIPSIQVDWTLYGPKLAQVALLFGADDLDGVPASDEADLGRRRAALEEVKRNITAASLSPVERDARWGIRAA